MSSLKGNPRNLILTLFSLLGILWGTSQVYRQYQSLEKTGLEREGGREIVLAHQSRGKIVPFPKEVEGDPLVPVLDPDDIPAVDHPQWVLASHAKIRAFSPIIGVAIKSEAHAYSLWLLNHHEIVNDVVGEEPIAVTW